MRRSLIISAVAATTLWALAYAGVFSALLSANYLPHRYCYLAQPGMVWTNVSMDGLIAVSYAVIFGCLFWIAAKLRKLTPLDAYIWIFLAFGSFILACGGTHVMEMVTVWWPVYRLSAAVKVICAAASLPTAILFARASPQLALTMRRFLEMLSTTQQEREQAVLALIASEKLAVAGRISATISHEIQNPLQTTGDILYLLSEDSRIPGDAARMLRTAACELERAKGIALSTLSLYRESSDPVELSLSALINSVVELQRSDLLRRNISVSTRMRTPVPLIAYPSELRQILINLIQNAADAMGRDGSFVIRVQPRRRLCLSSTGQIHLPKHASADGKMADGYSISVADTGPGIALSHRARLFTLFFTTKGDHGTGLGLWLVRSMVEMQGGRIRFRSRTAEESSRPGTIFNIWIPLAPAGIAPVMEAEALSR